MKSNVAEDRLQDVMRTAARDYEAHMDLISKKVQLFGVPGHEVIDYAAWSAQCKHEFENQLLTSAHYDGIKVNVNPTGERGGPHMARHAGADHPARGIRSRTPRPLNMP